MSYASTATETYSFVDVEIVIRRVTADLIMIANSTGAWTEDFARKVGHDIELLAKKGYLNVGRRDPLQLRRGAEGVRFEVKFAAGSLSMSRPGGVLWPRVWRPPTCASSWAHRRLHAYRGGNGRRRIGVSWTTTNTDTQPCVP